MQGSQQDRGIAAGQLLDGKCSSLQLGKSFRIYSDMPIDELQEGIRKRAAGVVLCGGMLVLVLAVAVLAAVSSVLGSIWYLLDDLFWSALPF